MKKQLLHTVLVLLTTHLTTAQVLFSEDFDNLTVGDLSTDFSDKTPGQGGWHVADFQYNSSEVKIVPEMGKGNVLGLGSKGGIISMQARQPNLNGLLATRDKGNEIILFEYEMYIPNTAYTVWFNANFANLKIYRSGNITNVSHQFVKSNSSDAIYFKSDGTRTNPGTGANYINFPYNTWISVQIFVDYINKNIHFYAPLLNINSYRSLPTPNWLIANFSLYVTTGEFAAQSAKFDNIRISALPSLPSYLGVDDFITSKFNIFPNPATDWVVITNSENIGIEQIEVYDINGKLIHSIGFKNKNEVSLNVSNLSSGTYLLHIKTDKGIAIKKLVKK